MLMNKQSVKSIWLQEPPRQAMLKLVRTPPPRQNLEDAARQSIKRAKGESTCPSQQSCGQQYCCCQPHQLSQAATCPEVLGTAKPAGSERCVLCSSQDSMMLFVMPSKAGKSR